MHVFPVSAVVGLLPSSLALLLKLVVCLSLAHPRVHFPEKIVSFSIAHYQDYLHAAVATAEERVIKPLKANVQDVLEAAKNHSEEQQQQQQRAAAE
ncbi:hypothetical protein ACSSS7_001490 [Eimeria intestinalis]